MTFFFALTNFGTNLELFDSSIILSLLYTIMVFIGTIFKLFGTK